MTIVKFQLESLTCPSCIKKIETALAKLNGVTEAKVFFNSSKVKTTFNESKINIDDLQQTIEKLGYPVLKSNVSKTIE